ncbi:hypothetical protein SAMN05443663_102500 [Flavobacterium defluvii]|uniref:Uncharacterized protein n=1 Tax=Flavobacterium defluvii TaxID=370979 RepID=A0A1M5ISS0_9FLAO|nr:hypothetical protein SAMN05443663_102500 [Flavobacterium defluvii]
MTLIIKILMKKVFKNENIMSKFLSKKLNKPL